LWQRNKHLAFIKEREAKAREELIEGFIAHLKEKQLDDLTEAFLETYPKYNNQT